ncbi:MAG TPA: hypothetical protein VIU61_06700 [Kofleriaceae bacterium]
MTYRDDRDALLHRVDALEDELERTRREAEQLRADNEKLRTPSAPAPIEPPPPPEPTRALVKRRVPLTREGLGFLAALAGLVPWLAVAVAAGPALWMLPAAVATSVLAAVATRWTRSSRVDTLLPFDHASLNRLVSQNRRAVVVKLDVRFDPLPNGSQRKAIKSQLARAGLRPSWADGVLTLSSRRLRAAPPIHAFVQRALGALGDLTGIEIVSVVARAGS